MSDSITLRALRVLASTQVSKGVKLSSADSEIQIIEKELHELEDRVDALVQFHNHYEFPTEGVVGNLYVATDEKVIYIWNGDHYIAVTGIDALQRQIDEINGGGS